MKLIPLRRRLLSLRSCGGSTDLYHSKRTSLQTRQSRLASSGKSAMVGFRDDLIQTVDRLTGYPPSLEVTILARNVYTDPRTKGHFHNCALARTKGHFHICALASISQECREREVWLSLLDSMEQLSTEMHQEKNTEELKEYLYKSLKGRRYLAVLDDVWTTEDWDSLSRIFPDDGIGSRIILTTRLLSAVDSHSSPPSYAISKGD
ncbi:late blight resistance homolog R1A-3 isoform X1 [Olea europaea subsp. europaea]|uniref:Late blight resistance homolog R1A-3 isoform X1 n=1 Tax=Olea europaea subsp. europaea TaxID=158383 RepID=A0A8S0SQQ0_OLEEU|nr:late blight resistance homolog R1A-3 isoform X1 [Olea europaea subsp. europaea]